MSLEAYCDYLLRRALGWLDWPEERALHADINAIEVAIAGKLEMFEVLGLITVKDKPKASTAEPPKDARGRPIVLTPALFDELYPNREPGTWQIRRKVAE